MCILFNSEMCPLRKYPAYIHVQRCICQEFLYHFIIAVNGEQSSILHSILYAEVVPYYENIIYR